MEALNSTNSEAGNAFVNGKEKHEHIVRSHHDANSRSKFCCHLVGRCLPLYSRSSEQKVSVFVHVTQSASVGR